MSIAAEGLVTAGQKYQPLHDWLQQQNSTQFSMNFTDVEDVISASLPPSARRYRAYWCNANPLGRAIRDAGWKPDRVDLAAERVDFVQE